MPSDRLPATSSWWAAIAKTTLVILLLNGISLKIERLFTFVLMALLVAGMWRPAFVHGETTIIPSAFGSGRYDTNIFRAPASLLAPGTQLSDFAGIVGGDVQLLHKSREVDANLKVAGDYNAYVTNTNLNYISTRVKGYVILDRWVERFAKGMRLTVSESFQYTPETPSFLAAEPQAPVGGDAFFRGVQNFRANTFSNATSVRASYPLARSLALRGDYSFLLRRFGTALNTNETGVNLIDSAVNTYSAGPEFQLTPLDSIAFLFRQAKLHQVSSTGAFPPRDTDTQSLTVDYNRAIPDWRFNLVGGAVLIEPAGQWHAVGSMKISNNPERATIVTVSLSRQASPSFFLQSGVMISNVGQMNIIHHPSERLTLGGQVAYAYNVLADDASFTYQNFTAGADLNYKVTRTVGVTLFCAYSYLNNNFIKPGFQISPAQVGFALTAQWN